MKIEIRLLTQMKKYLPDPDLAGNARWVDMEKEGTLRDLFATLGIPADTPKVILLNDRQGRLDDPLADGDRVTVFPPVGGG